MSKKATVTFRDISEQFVEITKDSFGREPIGLVILGWAVSWDLLAFVQKTTGKAIEECRAETVKEVFELGDATFVIDQKIGKNRVLVR